MVSGPPALWLHRTAAREWMAFLWSTLSTRQTDKQTAYKPSPLFTRLLSPTTTSSFTNTFMSSSPSSDRSSFTESSLTELSEKVGDLLISSTLPSDLCGCSPPSTASGRSQSSVSSGAENPSAAYELLLDLEDVMHAAFSVPDDWRTAYSHLIEVVRQDGQFQKSLAAFRGLKETVDKDKKIGLLQEMDSCVRRMVAHNTDISSTPPGSQYAIEGAADSLFQAVSGVNFEVYDLRLIAPWSYGRRTTFA
ncbi:hypothetical protein BDZ89DRAFT_266253 [Hymenopellis radicata]|nr:hypothetical protein BDZ89DRAFT_266253 [Hymenopellis radicata]